MTEIHQILPDIRKGDAISNEVLIIQGILRDWGYKSEIFAKNIHPGTGAVPFKRYQDYSSKKNILIFHYSIGSDVSDFVKRLPDKLILIYHNQTPERYFWGVNEYTAGLLRKGKRDLNDFSKITQLGLGDSKFNCRELKDLGFEKTGLLPLVIDFNRYSRKNDKIIRKYSDKRVNLLFVGRIAPNKRQDDIIKIFYYFKKIHPESRLFLIGSYLGCEAYYRKLRGLIEHLSLSDIIMPGDVCDDDLNAYYSIADIFLCMSEHEGFCVPLIECMFFRIPIIAHNSTAIPDTLGDSGILINNKNYCEIAELINIIINDEKLQKKIIEKQKERLKAFEPDKIKRKLMNYISEVLSN